MSINNIDPVDINGAGQDLSYLTQLGALDQTKIRECLPDPDKARRVFAFLNAMYSQLFRICINRSLNLTSNERAILESNYIGINLKQYHGFVNTSAMLLATQDRALLRCNSTNTIYIETNYKIISQFKEKYIKQGYLIGACFVDYTNYTMTSNILPAVSDYVDATIVLNNLTKQTQSLGYYVSGMRDKISADTSGSAVSQGVEVIRGAGAGLPFMTDAGDRIETIKPDIAAVTAVMENCIKRIANKTGLGRHFFTGDVASGFSTDSETDLKIENEAVIDFFNTVYKPCVKQLLGNDHIEYNNFNIDRLIQAINVLPTLNVIDNPELTQLLTLHLLQAGDPSLGLQLQDLLKTKRDILQTKQDQDKDDDEEAIDAND